MIRPTPRWRGHTKSAARVNPGLRAAAVAAGLGDGYSGHSGRVGMAQALAADGAGLPELMEAGRWESPTMPARYIKEQQAGCGAVAKYHRKRGAGMPPGDDAVPEDEATPGAQDPKTTPACPKALNRLPGQGISRNCPVNARLCDCPVSRRRSLRRSVT